MGVAERPVLAASRLLNASRVPLAADNIDVIGYNKANEFIVVAQIDEEKGPWNTQYTLRWRDVAGGAFAPLAAAGKIKWGTATDLINGNAVVIGEKACTNTPAGSDWQDGEEVEGAATCDAINLADEYYTEIHFACNPNDADAGHEYEFELWDENNGAAVGTLLATIKMATAPIVKIMAETEGLNEAALRKASAIKLFAETLGLTEAAVRRMWAVRTFAETIGIVETFIKALVAGPTYFAKVGSFNIDPSKGVTQTQSISGLGFQPKIVLFWWGGSTASSDTVAGGTYCVGFGAAISSGSRFCVAGVSDDAAADSNAARAHYVDSCIRVYSNGEPTLDGIMDFSSMDADGFTLVVDDQFTNAYRISYLALGGTDLTNVYIGNKAEHLVIEQYQVTGVGFQPDVLITAFAGRATLNSVAGGLNMGIGMATSSNNQGVLAIPF